MPEQPPELRILWTALPRSADDDYLVLDVFVSHRLGVDAPDGTDFVLSNFPEVVDWPAQVTSRLTFAVDFSDGSPAATATRMPWTSAGDTVDLHPPTWQRLFPPTTRVEPWTRRNPGSRPIFSFPVTAVADYIQHRYQHAAQQSAIDPTADDDLDDLGDELGALLDTRPDAERPDPTSQTTGGDTIGGGPAPSSRPLGCLAAPFAWLIWLVRRLRQLLFGGPAPDPKPSTQGAAPPPVSVTPKHVTYTFPAPGTGPNAPVLTAIDQHVAATGVSPPAGWTPPGTSMSPGAAAVAGAWRFYRRPESEPPRTPQPDAALVPPPPSVPDWDFHQRMGALGDYPGLLRRLGTVIRLRVPRPANSPATVRVVPLWDGQPKPQRDLTPRSRCVLDATGFRAEARAGSELREGFLDLRGASENSAGAAGFRMLVVDADGAALKLVHTAASLVRRRHLRLRGLVRDEPQPEGLAALRTAGIAIVREGQAAALKQHLGHLDAIAAATGNDAPDELFGSDVVRGFRVEVQDVTGAAPGEWRSLCQRTGTYHLLADDGAVLDTLQITDQGYVKRSTATSADATNSPLYVHEALVRWTGWSLVAPRPGRRIQPVEGTREDDGRTVPTQQEEAVPPRSEARPELHLAATFRPVDGTLQRLRLGHRYRFRLPAVDLVGESSPASEATPVSDAITYRRFEPLAPPALLPAGPFMAGESNERLVIRSDVTSTPDDYAASVLKPIDDQYRADAIRHVFPAKVTHEQAEQHGCLDDAIGSTDPAMLARGWNISLRADNALSITSLRSLDDPEVTAPFGVPGGGPIAGSSQTYVINSYAGTLPTPYMPDPLATAVGLRGLPASASIAPGAALNVEQVPGTNDRICLVPLEQANWPEVQSFRLRVVERPGTVNPADGVQTFTNSEDPPHWDPATRVLTVFLAKGQTAKVHYSSVPQGDRLDWLGPVQWLAAPAGGDLERHIAIGCHWMVSPARTLTLVHAVQRPLAPAVLTSGVAAKVAGATFATVTGRMRLDPASTGQVTLLATWEDQIDDGASPALITVKREAVLDTFAVPLLLADGTPGDATFPPTLPLSEPVTTVPARHEFGDTRHRIVDYRLRASTRFREYFPPGLQGLTQPDGSDGFSRVGDGYVVSVPNSEPPAAPAVRYAVPSFGWDSMDPQPASTWTSFERARIGGGVRVFLDRPWFTSGPGEEVGVVVAQPGHELPADTGSQLGVDPTWHSAYAPTVPVLTASMFSGGTTHSDVPLREGIRVDIIGYEPSLDVDRNLWYVDVTIDMTAVPASYWPFVRLALTRFQPESIKRAMASEIVLSEPIQLAPDRRLTVTVTGSDVKVQVSGVGPAQRDRNLMVIALDEADTPDPDELAWRPLGSAAGAADVADRIEARLADAVEPVPTAGDLRWERVLTMPGPRGDRSLRVIVRELELREADPDVVEERFADLDLLDPVATSVVRRRQLPRVVYADAVRLA